MIQNKRHTPNLEEILPRAELQKDRPEEFNRISERSQLVNDPNVVAIS